MKLVIGDKTFSSWSMRSWLVLHHAQIPFTEIDVHLRGPQKTDLKRFSPSALVPVLHHGDQTIWDTLAIAEYLNDTFPEKQLWPAEVHERALARSVTAEMHSGFSALRRECPMDLALTRTIALSPEASADVRRFVTLAKSLRQRFKADGAFLAGPWSIADAFYTPLATRIRSYGIDLAAHGDDGTVAAYVAMVLATPECLAWEKGAADQRAGLHR